MGVLAGGRGTQRRLPRRSEQAQPPRSVEAGGGRIVPGVRKSAGGHQWPRDPAPEGPGRWPTTRCLGLRLGQRPAGALVGLGMGEAPSGGLWSPADGGTPGAGSAWHQGVSQPSASPQPALCQPSASPLAHRHSAQQPMLPGRGPRVWQKEHRFRRPPRKGASPSPSQPHPSCVTQALSEAISSPKLTTSRAALAGTGGSLGHKHRPVGRSRQAPRDEAVSVQRCSGHGAPHSLPPPDTPGLPRHPPGPTEPTLAPVSPFSLPTTHFSCLH